MKRRVLSAAATGAVCLLAAGCGGAGPARRVLNDPRGGGSVTLKPGQELAVNLPVNYGIGTTWVSGPKPAAAVLRYRGAKYVPEGRQLPGSGGHERFLFEAHAKGYAQAVFLHYYRGKLTERRRLAVVVR